MTLGAPTTRWSYCRRRPPFAMARFYQQRQTEQAELRARRHHHQHGYFIGRHVKISFRLLR
jgi:hypothetical protein